MLKPTPILGAGIVCALGTDKCQVLQSLQQGRSGIGRMCYLPSIHTDLPVGEVPCSNQELKQMLNIDCSREVSRTALLGIMAVREALNDANVTAENLKGKRVVLISGTTVAGMDLTEQHYKSLRESNQHADVLLQHDCGRNTAVIADYFGLFADLMCISTACSSAANAIALGAEMLNDHKADYVVAGGSEALSLFHLNGFNSLMILDHEHCRPFDATRAGLNLGEGAAYVVMGETDTVYKKETKEHIYISGYGIACDAYHQTASSPNGDGATLAMTQAMACCSLSPSEIDYVNAHGTGTPNNDASESAALRRVFCDSMPPVSSTKSMTGHTTSASGAIETVICMMAMKHGFIPANLGWQGSDEETIMPTKGERHAELHHVLCNSFGFGGNDTSLLLSDTPIPALAESCVPLGDDDIEMSEMMTITDENQLAELSQYVKPMEVRRMGKLMRASLLTSYQALAVAGIEKPDAIITATEWGCLDYTERLLDQLTDEGEDSVKPTYFMQSTHNTLGSNIAIRLGCKGYNITISDAERSMQRAIEEAKRLIRWRHCKSVLVGCHDERTPRFDQLLDSLNMPKQPSLYSQSLIIRAKTKNN